MDSNLFVQYSQIEPSAPVAGGLRWRRRSHDVFDCCRGKGFVIGDPDAPLETEPPQPEPGAVLAPQIVSAPPPEARAGEEYVYQARAFDGIADGFTWSVLTGPSEIVVDRHSGKLSWTPAAGGYVDIVLSARSLYGASAEQRWTVRVHKAAPVHRFAPNPRIREALRRKKIRVGPLPTRFHSVWRAPRKSPGAPCRPTGPPSLRLRAALPLRL